MQRPDLKTVEKLAEHYSVIPVCREIFADSTTPIAVLRKLSAKSSRYFLLESVEGGEKWGRYSFLGWDPKLRVTCRKKEILVTRGEQKKIYRDKNPMDVIRDILKEYKSPVDRKSVV